jgi:hypothetical protein
MHYFSYRQDMPLFCLLSSFFCQMPLPQPLPEDATTTSFTALQNAWKIGIEFTGPNTGAGQSNPLAGFSLMTSLPTHLYQPARTTTTLHCMTTLPIIGIIISDFCLLPTYRSGIMMGALRHYCFPHTSQHHFPSLTACLFSTLSVNGIHFPPSVVDYGYALLSLMQYLATCTHSFSFP